MDRSVSVTSRLALALASLRKGQYQEASDAARGEGQGSHFTSWSLVSAIHGKAGRLEEARFAAGELLKLYPDFADWALTEMEARTIGHELASAMPDGWRGPGLPVPPSARRSNPQKPPPTRPDA